ncbi:hypothetical protein ACOI1H_20715 [Loktanella sp. DJP18]|uniref:hypothetical protein n=1 Tax=Loktanella sp. DJP18 TaxID=3409788 RepID=UPI003BB781CC
MFASTFINDPTTAEFYHRRIYARCMGPIDNFCVMNNAAAPAYHDWDQSTGIEGLMACVRKWHQPDGHGSDAQIRCVAEQMIEMATLKGHLPAAV